MKVKSIFDFIGCLTYNKTPWESLTESEQKMFEPFMIHRFISMNADYLELCNFIQKYSNLSKKMVYKLYLDVLPKSKVYAPYIKAKDNGSKIKFNDTLLKFLAKKEEWSIHETENNLLWLMSSKEGVKLLKAYLVGYGFDEVSQKKEFGIT